MRAAGKLGVVVALLMGLWCASAQALALTQVGPKFDEPMYVTSDPGNPDHLFVVERAGTIRLLENGSSRLFADLSSLVSCCDGERGLQSIALAPDFATSGRLFAFYSGKEVPGEIHVAELRNVGGTAPLGTVRNLLTIPHPDFSNHYGGQLQFGPEGNLFISTGDGGDKDDSQENAQDRGSLLGKLLRIDPDPEGVLPYGIPAGNPFSAPGERPEIWSLGLRNPYRFSFDRQTGDVWIGDVGQDAREEVDFAAAPGLGGGANYGWNCREGRLTDTVTPEEAGCATATGFVDPVFDYPNPSGGCGAIIGGYVARGPGLGDLLGRYLYGDLCIGDIRSFSPAAPFGTDRDEGAHVESLYSFGQDSCGRLYAVSGEGPVYRLGGPAAAICPTAEEQQPTLSTSRVGIRALRRRVKRNRRAFITAWVSPCKGRRGQPVSLWQGNRRVGTRRLDRVCSVRFRPRIKHRVAFRAKVTADGTYAEATSRRLKIRILRRHHKRG